MRNGFANRLSAEHEQLQRWRVRILLGVRADRERIALAEPHHLPLTERRPLGAGGTAAREGVRHRAELRVPRKRQLGPRLKRDMRVGDGRPGDPGTADRAERACDDADERTTVGRGRERDLSR